MAIARAVERGWVILWGTSGKPLELKAAAVAQSVSQLLTHTMLHPAPYG